MFAFVCYLSVFTSYMKVGDILILTRTYSTPIWLELEGVEHLLRSLWTELARKRHDRLLVRVLQHAQTAGDWSLRPNLREGPDIDDMIRERTHNSKGWNFKECK